MCARSVPRRSRQIELVSRLRSKCALLLLQPLAAGAIRGNSAARDCLQRRRARQSALPHPVEMHEKRRAPTTAAGKAGVRSTPETGPTTANAPTLPTQHALPPSAATTLMTLQVCQAHGDLALRPMRQLPPAAAPCLEAVAAAANAAVEEQPPASSKDSTSGSSLTGAIVIAATGPANNYYCNRRSWISTDRMNELRRKAQEAVKQNKTFTIRGCFQSVRTSLIARGWVEKLDAHRKHVPTGICQVTYDDLAQGLPKRKPGETRRQYVSKCERNIMSRFLEHMPIDFLWTNRKEKCDYIDQAKNPGMTINKFHRAPFTSKEGLCTQLREFHWYYDEGTAELYFPRCFNVWSPEELGEFVENYKLTACIAFVRAIVENYRNHGGYDAVFSPTGKIPYSAIDFALKRCAEFLESCQHSDIDAEDPPKIWEHDWDAFLCQHQHLVGEAGRIQCEPQRSSIEHAIRNGAQTLDSMQRHWPQYTLDGCQNLWIVKPANKCRGRGIQLMDNLKKILAVVNPAIASKSRYVVQKYIERPLIIHHTKFDIRQWFLITNVQPLVVWMYRESYLRFSSQEYSLTNHHESVHLTNHAIQKKYTNGRRDRRLPNENMWDCYSFQAYLRQIGKQDMWLERIYPGMRKAIVGTMLASQDNMDRRPNTFELFGADFMICEDFYPWLIEINSSPDLGATTSVTARMCPQCLEDVIKVVIDRRTDPKADLGNFDLIYRQIVPPTPAYMGLNLFVKGKQIVTKVTHNPSGYFYHHQRRERSLNTSQIFRQRTALIPSIANVHKTIMPTFNATELMEKCLLAEATLLSSRSSNSGGASAPTAQPSPMHGTTVSAARRRPRDAPPLPCPSLLRSLQPPTGVRRKSCTNLVRLRSPGTTPKSAATATTTASQQQELNAVPLKRHRSCGPCLPTSAATTATASTASDDVDKKFKFIIKKCTLPKSSAVAACRSENNLMEMVLAAPTKPNGETEKLTPPTVRSQSCLTIEQRKTCRRRRQLRNMALKTQAAAAEAAAAAQQATAKSGERELSRHASVVDGVQAPPVQHGSGTMHAIGKGLSTWRSSWNRRDPNRKLLATPAAAKSASSVYACKQAPPVAMGGASSELVSRAQYSPRRKRQNTKC